MPAELLRENKLVDPLHKKDKNKPLPEFPSVVSKLQRRLSKEQAANIFRHALGKSASKYGAPAGELNFRRYCVAAQAAAKLLVHGEDHPNSDTKPGEQSGRLARPAAGNRKRVVALRAARQGRCTSYGTRE